MTSAKVGDHGHVCFVVLAPRPSHVEKTELRNDVGEIQYIEGDDRKGPILVDRQAYTAETFPTDETHCHLARITSIASGAEGEPTIVRAAGWNDEGVERRWTGVVLAAKPKARLEDPAGHVFHALDACPWER